MVEEHEDLNFTAGSERYAAILGDLRQKVHDIVSTLTPERARRLEAQLPEDVREAIAQSLQGQYGPERSRDIGFHLLDWSFDAGFLVALILFPERFTKAEIKIGITNFLVHVPNHVAAAAKLFGTPVEDAFGINALDRQDDDN